MSISVVSMFIASGSRSAPERCFLWFHLTSESGSRSLGFQGPILTFISLYLCTICLATDCHSSKVTGRVVYSERIFLWTVLVSPLKKMLMLPLSWHDHPALIRRTSK